MRAIQFGQFPPNASVDEKLNWIVHALHEIEIASHEEQAFAIADAFTLTNIPDPPDRSLSGTESGAANIAAVLATLLADLKAREFRP